MAVRGGVIGREIIIGGYERTKQVWEVKTFFKGLF